MYDEARRRSATAGHTRSENRTIGTMDELRSERSRSQHIAVYAGSFDPITFGHMDVLRRARTLFDGLILGIGTNPDKPALFSFDERVDVAQQLVDEMLEGDPDGAPVRVERYTGLTVEFARSNGACAIVRGIRNITDLANECQLAITNRQVADIETVFIVTGEAYAFTSSSLIRQIAGLGGDLDRLSDIIPPTVIEMLREKRDDPNNPLGRLARDQHMD